MLQVTSTCRPPIVQLVEQQLRRSGYGQLSSLDVSEFEPGCVRIEGSVRSYYMKQVAQEMAMSVPGVELVENRINVTCKVAAR